MAVYRDMAVSTVGIHLATRISLIIPFIQLARRQQRSTGSTWDSSVGAKTFVRACVLLMICAVASPSAQAQTFRVLHTFTGGNDGGTPRAGVSVDYAGNLYGTTENGGISEGGCTSGCGLVYKLRQSSGAWILNPLYSFQGGADGYYPQGPIIIGPNGSLYSVTNFGGASNLGTVFNLRPPAQVCRQVRCGWTKSVLYQLTGNGAGAGPEGFLAFDSNGNIYGTTNVGGHNGSGVAYQLTHTSNGWAESVLYDALNNPFSGLILDQVGNLEGTEVNGGDQGYGSVYQITHTESGWTFSYLLSFDGNNGADPVGNLLIDAVGNLYGTTATSDLNGGGIAYQLTRSNGWMFTMLADFPSGVASYSGLARDPLGNLYGALNRGGNRGLGSIFKLTLQNGGWTMTSLYEFTGGSDGSGPVGSLALDSNGNLYGVAAQGGGGSCPSGCGVVWQITP
jgi:hypothetical protein